MVHFRMQAQKALGRSGRVFSGTLMIGVTPCLDPPSEAVNSSHILDQSATHNPANSSVMSLNSSLATHGHNRSIRPLTQSYMAAHNDHEVNTKIIPAFLIPMLNRTYLTGIGLGEHTEQKHGYRNQGYGIYFWLVIFFVKIWRSREKSVTKLKSIPEDFKVYNEDER